MQNKIVSREEWLRERKAHLAAEKELTRQRDLLSKRRRELPWVQVNKQYNFESVDGNQTLSDLFNGKSQLIIYHFMFEPAWEEGCKSCSFLADNYNGGMMAHLEQRDARMVTVSRAPLEKLQAFRRRMGWNFKWVSSSGSDFNRDFGVTFTLEEIETGTANYNYGSSYSLSENHGVSVFYKNRSGDIFHTYSTYARGVDMLINSYNYLDLLPKGRDEAGLKFTMEWVKLRDCYGSE